MKNLFTHVKKSIYGPEYYRELLTQPLAFSWKYYSAFACALALCLTIVSSIALVPWISKTVHEFPEQFFAYYPDALKVEINKGVVTSNVTEPYFLPVPEQFMRNAPLGASRLSFMVIDTATPFSLEQFNAYGTMVWLGGHQLAFRDGKSGVRIESFDPQTNLTVNEGTLRIFEQRLQPWYKFAAVFAVMGAFLGLLVVFGLNFVYLLLGALFILLLGRLLKQRWSYGAAYRIGLHAMTLPVLLDTFFSALNFPILHLPFLFTVAMLAIVMVNFKNISPVVVSTTEPVA
jgi:hypothetical protein